MFLLLIAILLYVLLGDSFPLFLVALVLSIVLYIALLLIYRSRKQPKQEAPERLHYKIGSEVSERFYDEVNQYCRKHHITVSDLIRKAVRTYMDSNK